MRGICRQNFLHSTFPILAVLLAASLAAFGQSLGDAARQTREQKAAQQSTAPPPQVITNAEMPKDPDAVTTASGEGQGESPETGVPAGKLNERQRAHRRLADQRTAAQRAAEQRAAAQWKEKILQQENVVADLRMRADQLKALIRRANVTTYNDMPYNREQARHLQRLAEVQLQLDQQRRKLEDLQEAARHAGMHTLVYDP
ncbi:MAG: hypothetical protein WBQ72_16405 [Terriglobales bacterium]|jgi:hypothetical protein